MDKIKMDNDNNFKTGLELYDQDFFDALPDRIKNQLRLISKNNAYLLKKYIGELKEILETDYDVASCVDKDFKIHLAYMKFYARNTKKIRLQGSINKWIDGEEEIDWNL